MERNRRRAAWDEGNDQREVASASSDGYRD